MDEFFEDNKPSIENDHLYSQPQIELETIDEKPLDILEEDLLDEIQNFEQEEEVDAKQPKKQYHKFHQLTGTFIQKKSKTNYILL